VCLHTHTHTHTNSECVRTIFPEFSHKCLSFTQRLHKSKAYSASGGNDKFCCKISGTVLQLSLPPLSYLIKTQAPSSTTCNTTHYLHDEFRATVLDNTARYSTDLDNSIRKYALSFGSVHAFQLVKSDVD